MPDPKSRMEGQYEAEKWQIGSPRHGSPVTPLIDRKVKGQGL